MSYNLKTKTVIILALTFAVMMSVNGVSYAEDVAPVPEEAQADSLLTIDSSGADQTQTENTANESAPDTSVAEATASADAILAPEAEVAVQEQSAEVVTEPNVSAEDVSSDLFGGSEELFVDDITAAPATETTNENPTEMSQETPVTSDEAATPTDNSGIGELNLDDSALNDSAIDAEFGLDSDAGDDLFAEEETNGEKKQDAIPTAEAPKSPFESFGNAILSKVDNDLFNQMSNIEKQNTLLNLEL